MSAVAPVRGAALEIRDLTVGYGGAEGDAFKLAGACYPKGDKHD